MIIPVCHLMINRMVESTTVEVEFRDIREGFYFKQL